MRLVRVLPAVAALALLSSLCTAMSTTSTAVAQADPPPNADAAERAERALRADATDPVTVSTRADGLATFVGTLGRPVEGGAQAADAIPVKAARGYLARYGDLFGIARQGEQLSTTVVHEDAAGSHVVRFGQQVDGLPVLGGELAVSLDRDGDLESVNGETTDPQVATPTPEVSAADAARTAVQVTARAHATRTDSLVPGPVTQWLYDPEVLGIPDPSGSRPVWRVEVTNGLDIRELVLVDTATGRVATHVNQVPHALDRVVCDRRVQAGRGLDRPCVKPYERTETSPAARGEAERAFVHTGDTAALFETLGVDLTELIGNARGVERKKLRSTVKINMDNAFWSGTEMYYGRGYARADDVVAHELTHGVVQHTSNLFYWYQSGAINESMADVFGELVDQRNGTDRSGGAAQWLLGEDTPNGPFRNMRNPGEFGQPDRMRSARYTADRDLFDNGGVHSNSGVGNKAAYLIADGGRFNGQTIRGLDESRADRVKTAHVYFRALQMLTSGSDYADLGRVLPQACRAWVGTAGITESDCDQVRSAVAATEMQRQPVVASAPEARRCPRGSSLNGRVFLDDMEGALTSTWRLGRLWSRSPHAGRGIPEYADSGRRSLFGFDPAPEFGEPRNSSLTLLRRLRPPPETSTYLRFDHAYLFEHNFRSGARAVYYDGGRLEYSTNRGRTWSNTESLPWVNGPDRPITLGTRRTRFRGFGGDSHGYESSRLDLSRFAGRTVQLRWKVSGDAAVGFLGWWLDDVEVYSCR